MRVDVDDQHVVEALVAGLLGGVREQLAGVEFVDLYASTAVSYEVHVNPSVF